MLGRRANMPPLGLITVAAMLPDRYAVRLVDMNVEPLLDQRGARRRTGVVHRPLQAPMLGAVRPQHDPDPRVRGAARRIVGELGDNRDG